MNNPFDVNDSHDENENQAALFRYLAMLAAWGREVANNPQTYVEQGFAKKFGKSPDPTFAENIRLIYAVPNGLKLDGGARAGGAAKATGLRPGIPDICVPVPMYPYHSMYIELKAKDGKLRDSQKIIIPLLQSRGHLVHITVGWRNAANKIEKYLQGDFK